MNFSKSFGSIGGWMCLTALNKHIYDSAIVYYFVHSPQGNKQQSVQTKGSKEWRWTCALAIFMNLLGQNVKSHLMNSTSEILNDNSDTLTLLVNVPVCLCTDSTDAHARRERMRMLECVLQMYIPKKKMLRPDEVGFAKKPQKGLQYISMLRNM